MDFSITFIKKFFSGIYLVSPILMLLVTIIIILGLLVGRLEYWKKFDSLYWASITALTVGYGDIRPNKKRSRVMAVFIALLGIMLTGIIVAITVETASRAFQQEVAPEIFKQPLSNQ